MNVDATPLNVGAKMIKYHVKTASEVRHDLEGAAYFSELDMGFGFHQVPLSEAMAKNAVFQGHEGLHSAQCALWTVFFPFDRAN